MASRLVGIDLVRIGDIADSLVAFGEGFLRRIFTQDEIHYCRSRSADAALASLAARFAAKEATIKALDLSERGVNWRDIEVVRGRNGACTLRLGGAAADAVEAIGVEQLSLSMSHAGEYAIAVVVGATWRSKP